MTTTHTYKVMLADDHVLLRDALAAFIGKFEDIKVTGLASTGEELVSLISAGNVPDLVVLDLSMPKMDGYETANWLKENYPDVKILILTMFNSEIALIRLLRDGVRGFLKKDIHPEELRTALVSVAEDGYYYCNNTTGKLASLFNKNKHHQSFVERAMLSDREIEFLKYASTDMTYKEIAHHMKLTPRAIDGYRDALFDKLEVKSRVGLAIFAVKNGIVSF